jgi:GH24 family phage-related lysozyme (muramidase)
VPQVEYSVDLIDGVWTICLGEKRFGPYSTLDTAVAAASKAARKAEAQGYDAVLRINTPQDDVATAGDTSAA